MKRAALLVSLLALSLPALALPPVPTFVEFESGPVRPVALTANGQYLLVTNTPDNRLEVFDVLAGGGLSHTFSIPVGMEPVAVAARTNTDIWVVSHALGNTNQFRAYLVTAAGINPVPVNSNSGTAYSGNTGNTIGYMKISPDGNRSCALPPSLATNWAKLPALRAI